MQRRAQASGLANGYGDCIGAAQAFLTGNRVARRFSAPPIRIATHRPDGHIGLTGPQSLRGRLGALSRLSNG